MYRQLWEKSPISAKDISLIAAETIGWNKNTTYTVIKKLEAKGFITVAGRVSRKFFEELKATPIKEQLEHVICTCVEMKRDIVNQDEFDRGLRQQLNLGHSFGHAVEACSHFGVLHGQAVAIGMAAITRAAVAKGYCSEKTLGEVLDILNQYRLPTATGFGLEEMAEAALTDKKLTGGSMHLVVPEEIGRCAILSVPTGEIKDWMNAGGIGS